MRANILRLAGRLALPEGAVLLAAAVLWQWPALRTPAAGFLQAYPAVVLAAGVLLAWRFRRPRVLLSVTLLALTERALHHTGAGGPVYTAVSVLLPANLAVLSLTPIPSITGRRGLTALGIVIAEAVVVLVLRDPAYIGTVRLIDTDILPGVLTGWTPLPDLALLAFAGAFAVFGFRTALHPNALGRGFLWAALAAAVGLHAAGTLAVPPPGVLPSPPAPIPDFTFWLATAGLVFVVATVEMSHALAFRDGLTGLPGRRAFDEALARLTGLWAVVMVDVDHFKAVNDTHGHEIGDQVLRMVATILARGEGRAYRYGGEEFAVLYPGRTAAEAREAAEALRAVVEETPFVMRSADRPRRKPERPTRRSTRDRQLHVTVSAGVADASQAAAPRAVLEAADAALYQAKQQGRNRVHPRR